MKNVYKTKDIYLSAFLLLNQTKLVNTVPNSGIVFFQFEDSPQLQDQIFKYFARNTSVEPLQFIGTIRSLKNLIQDTLSQNIGRYDDK